MRKHIQKIKIKNNILELYFECVEQWNDEIQEIKKFIVCLYYNYDVQNGEHEFYYEEHDKLSDALFAFDRLEQLLNEKGVINESKN